jgi:hypothetical protein
VLRPALAVAAAAAALAAAPAHAAALPSCALGRLPASLRTFVPDAIAEAEKRHGATFAAAEAAYVYGLPPVLLRATVQRFPINQFVGIAQLTNAGSRSVVAPNHDTLYSVSQLDLAQGPVVITAPATAGRYSILQLLDAYTNDFAYVGAGAQRDSPQTVAVVPPGWQGALPDGVRRIDSPTNLVWLLGRTLIDGDADLPAARAVLSGYTVTPLPTWVATGPSAPLILDAFPAQQAPVLPAGVAFYDALGAALAANPPPAADACALRAFAAAGIGPGLTPSATAGARTLAAAAAAGAKLVDEASTVVRRASQKHNNGWASLGGDIGRFGTDYANRAVVAHVGLAANTPEQALYPNSDTDGEGRLLSGRHDYVIAFPAGGLPPVRAFWSLTLYGADRFFYPNPLDRFVVGDRTPGLRYGPGRSLTIYLRHRAPPAARRSNWLPAPKGRFLLWLRLYEPKPAAANGRWKPPTITRR